MSYIDDSTALLGTPAFEGTIAWLYLDSDAPPNATTACGLLVPNLAADQAMPWYRPDANPASADDIAADWKRVLALPGDKLPHFYYTATSLTLSAQSITALTRAKVVEFDGDLRADYPGYDSFPDGVKMALLDMEYNLGDVKLRRTYPHFDAAVDAQDWKTAAAECGRNLSDPAFNARNAWTKQQFLAACV